MVHMIAGRAGSGKSRRMYEMAEAAMEAGIAEAQKRELYITSHLIAGQSPEIEWFAHLNALGRDKLRGKAKPSDEDQSTEKSVKEI